MCKLRVTNDKCIMFSSVCFDYIVVHTLCVYKKCLIYFVIKQIIEGLWRMPKNRYNNKYKNNRSFAVII